MNQDPTQPVEPFLKTVLASLDQTNETFPNVESYATQFAKQLKSTSGVVLNGHPIVSSDSKLEFQKKWLASPLTSHQVTNYDCHIIPGTSTMIISVTGKVKFDESGKNRLNQSAELVGANVAKKTLWSSWFGFYLNLVVDEGISNDQIETINNFDYRIIYKPKDGVISI